MFFFFCGKTNKHVYTCFRPYWFSLYESHFKHSTFVFQRRKKVWFGTIWGWVNIIIPKLSVFGIVLVEVRPKHWIEVRIGPHTVHLPAFALKILQENQHEMILKKQTLTCTEFLIRWTAISHTMVFTTILLVHKVCIFLSLGIPSLEHLQTDYIRVILLKDKLWNAKSTALIVLEINYNIIQTMGQLLSKERRQGGSICMLTFHQESL